MLPLCHTLYNISNGRKVGFDPVLVPTVYVYRWTTITPLKANCLGTSLPDGSKITIVERPCSMASIQFAQLSPQASRSSSAQAPQLKCHLQPLHAQLNASCSQSVPVLSIEQMIQVNVNFSSLSIKQMRWLASSFHQTDDVNINFPVLSIKQMMWT